MPVISHSNLIEADDSDIVTRYLSKRSFYSLLEKKGLFFCRIDKFSDPFEGSLSKLDYLSRSNFEFEKRWAKQRGLVFTPENENQVLKNHEFASKQHKNMKMAFLANCWHLNQSNSDYMWWLYLKDNEGLAIQTNVSKIKKALNLKNENFLLSKIRYLNFDSDTFFHETEYPHTNYNFLVPLIHKRYEFKHENEFRILLNIPEAEKDELYWDKRNNDKGLMVEIDLNILIDKVIVCPTSEPNFQKDINNSIRKNRFNFKVEKAIMNQVVYY